MSARAFHIGRSRPCVMQLAPSPTSCRLIRARANAGARARGYRGGAAVRRGGRSGRESCWRLMSTRRNTQECVCSVWTMAE